MNRATGEIAANRFGMGARHGEISAARADPQGWLERQIGPLSFDGSTGSSTEVLQLLEAHQAATKQGRSAAGAPKAAGSPETVKPIAAMGIALAGDTLEAAIASPRPFASRLLDFYSNHFSVSMGPVAMRGLAATLEREAIAPHIAGRFEDMLLAVEQHPAMLTYLNNSQSVGPESRQGRRQARGLNENLAREILELHTLGVDGGYNQTDVRELAMGITGWSVGAPQENQERGFRFRPDTHQPGTRRMLGSDYPQSGETQGRQMLQALARHPATARHLCLKLARHVVADEPPPALVQALVGQWQATDGNLGEVARALVRHPMSWEPAQHKLKTPREFLVSVMRALQLPARGGAQLRALTDLGQSPLRAGSPAGFKDVASAWDGAEALMTRIDWLEKVVGRLRRKEPLDIARQALGSGLSARTLKALQGAASRQQGFSLLFMSPEFQRR